MRKKISRKIFLCRTHGVLLLLAVPYLNGCERTLRPANEIWVEGMSGYGRITQNIYYFNPPFLSQPFDHSPTAIGRYDANFLDGGIRAGYYNGSSGNIIEVGGGYIATIKESGPRWYNDTERTLNNGVRKSGYAYLKVGYDADDFGFKTGILWSDSLHFETNLFLPIFRFRIGRFDALHGDFGFMRNPTYLSSGSIVDAGVSFPLKEIQSDAYLGVGASSGYTSALVLGQIDVRASKNISIKATANGGVFRFDKKSGDPLEFGFAMGLKYLW